MKTVILRGPVLTQSGYGVHCRQVARWLLGRPDINVKFIPLAWGETPWLIDSNHSDGFIGEIMKRTVNPAQKADVSIQLQLPNEWDPSIAPINIGMTAAVETDRCNPAWIEACNKMSAIIVPSQHAKNCLNNSGTLTVPVHVIPESFADSMSKPLLPTLPMFSTSFNFLIFGQLTGMNPESDRKNIFYTIKWLCEAFKDDPDVGIVIKTNVGKNSKIDRSLTSGLISGVTAESRQGSALPKVHLLHGDMSEDEVAALYRHPQIKSLVTLTRGEGYGLPILEAAASGLPIIATDWSGHLDFLRLGKFISVYYQLQDVHKSRIDGQIFVPGARWAQASEEDFKKRVTKFKQSPSTPKDWALELKQKLMKTHSFEAISATYDAVLRDVI